MSTPKFHKHFAMADREATRDSAARSIFNVLELDRDHAVGACGNFMVIVWRDQTTAMAVARAEHALQCLIRTCPHGVGILQLAEPTATPPDGTSRAALARMLESGRRSIKCSSLVYAGTGFYMAAARAFVTGLTMVMRVGFPHEVFATVAEAANWHAPLLPPIGRCYTTQPEIVEAAAALTRALDKQLRPVR